MTSKEKPTASLNSPKKEDKKVPAKITEKPVETKETKEEDKDASSLEMEKMKKVYDSSLKDNEDSITKDVLVKILTKQKCNTDESKILV